MKPGATRYQDIPLNIVGSTKFGRYPKISNEQTFNMIQSDDALVPFAGYKQVVNINNNGVGRGIYSSAKLKKLFAVIDNNIIMFDNLLAPTYIGQTTTYTGDVFIAENNAGQVAFSDGQNLYIYTGAPTVITKTAAALGFTPGYLTFQDTYFISPAVGTSTWRLSKSNDGTDWPNDSQHVGALQTKPDNTVACIRFPGRGNLLLVFGSTVAEQWYDVGTTLFPYQRSQNTNIDYGCINPATIAESENIVAWIAINEKSGPVIMYTNGGEVKHISNDGIDFKFAELQYPSDCYGYMFKQDGHLFYVCTFVKDNLSYAFDFNTQQFYTLTDENMNAYIVKRVAFFNNNYYFVSIIDGNLYELGSQFTSYDYGDRIQQIPRIRILASIRLPDQSRFNCGYVGFTIEQGEALQTQRIDCSISKDGVASFSSDVGKTLNTIGKRQNRLVWWRLGMANDLVFQFKFHGFDRFVAFDGLAGIYQ